VIRFDADQQRWVDDDADALRARQHTESSHQQRHVARATLAVLAVCGLVFGVWALGWKDEPGPANDGSQPSVVVPDPSGTTRPDERAPSDGDEEPAEPSDPAGPTEAEPPEGYELAEDPEGFSLAVPEGWERRSEERDDAATVFYEKPGGSEQLQVFYVEDSDPYESLELAEDNAEKNEQYERESLDRLDGGDGPAARMEYTYDSDEHGGTRRVIDHRFEAEDGELYAIVVYGPDEDGASQKQKELLDTALTYFCPTGVDCGKDADAGGGDGDDGLGGQSLP
jgi:hypothetical protein